MNLGGDFFLTEISSYGAGLAVLLDCPTRRLVLERVFGVQFCHELAIVTFGLTSSGSTDEVFCSFPQTSSRQFGALFFACFQCLVERGLLLALSLDALLEFLLHALLELAVDITRSQKQAGNDRKEDRELHVFLVCFDR